MCDVELWCPACEQQKQTTNGLRNTFHSISECLFRPLRVLLARTHQRTPCGWREKSRGPIAYCVIDSVVVTLRRIMCRSETMQLQIDSRKMTLIRWCHWPNEPQITCFYFQFIGHMILFRVVSHACVGARASIEKIKKTKWASIGHIKVAKRQWSPMSLMIHIAIFTSSMFRFSRHIYVSTTHMIKVEHMFKHKSTRPMPVGVSACWQKHHWRGTFVRHTKLDS